MDARIGSGSSEAGGVRIWGVWTVSEICAVGPSFSSVVGDNGDDNVVAPLVVGFWSVVGDNGVGTPMVTCLRLRKPVMG